MRKDSFCICFLQKDEDDKYKIVALKVSGYTDGDIGLHKTQSFGMSREGWVATHLETGNKLTPTAVIHKTPKAALNEARKIIAENPNYEKRIQQVKEGSIYKEFLQLRNNQTITYNFVGGGR